MPLPGYLTSAAAEVCSKKCPRICSIRIIVPGRCALQREIAGVYAVLPRCLLDSLPPVSSNNISEPVLLVCELLRLSVEDRQVVVEDTRRLNNKVNVLREQWYGSQEYPPPSSCDAESVLGAPPGKRQ